jgi:hypothetical protein
LGWGNKEEYNNRQGSGQVLVEPKEGIFQYEDHDKSSKIIMDMF